MASNSLPESHISTPNCLLWFKKKSIHNNLGFLYCELFFYQIDASNFLESMVSIKVSFVEKKWSVFVLDLKCMPVVSCDGLLCAINSVVSRYGWLGN